LVSVPAGERLIAEFVSGAGLQMGRTAGNWPRRRATELAARSNQHSC
jgi:hypothetical protein